MKIRKHRKFSIFYLKKRNVKKSSYKLASENFKRIKAKIIFSRGGLDLKELSTIIILHVTI